MSCEGVSCVILNNTSLCNLTKCGVRVNQCESVMVPLRVSHVAIGESSKELAKPNLWILAILGKSINSSN